MEEDEELEETYDSMEESNKFEAKIDANMFKEPDDYLTLINFGKGLRKETLAQKNIQTVLTSQKKGIHEGREDDGIHQSILPSPTKPLILSFLFFFIGFFLFSF